MCINLGQFSPFFLDYFDSTITLHSRCDLVQRPNLFVLCVCILNDYDICQRSTRYLTLFVAYGYRPSKDKSRKAPAINCYRLAL